MQRNWKDLSQEYGCANEDTCYFAILEEEGEKSAHNFV